MTLMCLGAHASDPQLLIAERCVHWRKRARNLSHQNHITALLITLSPNQAAEPWGLL